MISQRDFSSDNLERYFRAAMYKAMSVILSRIRYKQRRGPGVINNVKRYGELVSSINPAEYNHKNIVNREYNKHGRNAYGDTQQKISA